VICQNCIKLIFFIFSNVAGGNAKDAILYSVVGCVIVIGIVAGLSIVYYRRRKHQHISGHVNGNDINLPSQIVTENPDESGL